MPQTAMWFYEWFGRLKCSATGLGASLSLVFDISKVLTETVTES